ncbi:MAG: LysM peptidoglycan-binding domain-containing protein [Flavipsychrobacter sp.]|nr:LysM peptidoglycan-binding domain-containing protein [Flavipsychrobacter sp.]
MARKKIFQFLYGLVILITLCNGCLAQVTTDNDTAFLYINPIQLNKNLTEKEKSIVLDALIKYNVRNSVTTTIQVQPNDNIYSIINKNFNFSDSKDYYSAKVISDNIKKLNNIDGGNKIYSGDILTIPQFPSKPGKLSSVTYTQLVSNNSNHIITYKTEDVVHNNMSYNEPMEQTAAQSQASLWAIKASESQIQEIFDSIPSEILSKIYGPAILEFTQPHNINVKFPDTSKSIDIESFKMGEVEKVVDSQISKIDPQYFGKYYVLDYFGESCSHGNKVYNVIQQIFKDYNIEIPKEKIVLVPINYYQNKEASLSFLKSYYSNMNDNGDSELKLKKLDGLSTVENLKRMNTPSDESAIPEKYLSARINTCYDSTPDVISASFYATVYEADVMPKYINSSTNFVVAGLDEEGKIIEDLSFRTPSPHTKIGNIEPLYTCYTQYTILGSIIVGCLMNDSSFFGIYSKNGDRVTTLGTGIGWGNNEFNCILSKDYGTSFATPEIAAKLFIAKAFWRSKQQTIDPKEARIRLLLASDIKPKLIGKFASGGVVNLSKLIQIKNGFTETNSGIISSSTIMPGSYIQYENSCTLLFQRLKHNDPSSICGIYFSDNSSYCFIESSMIWEKMDILNIKIILKSGEFIDTLNSVSEIKNKYREIISLSNPN